MSGPRAWTLGCCTFCGASILSQETFLFDKYVDYVLIRKLLRKTEFALYWTIVS